MNSNNNDIIYTAKDIEQYLAGKLSPLQMHAMEKAALDDDFLAEAIEGYAAIKPDDWKNNLSAVKNQFENKQEAKVISIPKTKTNWWKAAAAILIIGSATAIGYYIFNKKDNQQIAQIIPNKDSIVAPTLSPTISPSISDGEIAKVSEDKKNKAIEPINNIVTQIPQPIKVDSFAYSPSTQPSSQIKTEKEMNNNEADVVVVSPKPAPAASAGTTNNLNTLNFPVTNNNQGFISKDEIAKKSVPTAAKNQQPLNQFFKAQIVDANNTALPFSNISIKNENIGTYADNKGNFILVATDSVLTVDVKSVGYQPKTFTLKSNLQQNKLVLAQDDYAVRQTTVVGDGAFSKSKLMRNAILIKDSTKNVEPLDGWDKYNTYVTNNLEMPDEILSKDIHGQVQLSFDVTPNGAITNIKVDKSLCGNCDEAAKKLIQQGPQWKAKNNKTAKGKVIVQF